MNKDANSASMNGPRPLETFKHSSSQSSQIKELKAYNEKLYEENVNFNKQIRKLEESQAKLIKEYSELKYESNNTSTSFFLISQISEIWTELAKENIINCFIDFISQPELLFDLFQEMVYIIQYLIKEQIEIIVNSFIAQWNIEVKEKTFNFVSLSIRNVIKELYDDIFESQCVRTEDAFGKFKERYVHYIHTKLNGLINEAVQEQFIEDLDSCYFKKMYLNVQRILFFVEFKHNVYIDVYDNDSRLLEPINFKSNDCLCVEGRLNEQKSALILLDAPKTSSGFYAFNQLKPIVISYSKRSNSLESLRRIRSIRSEITDEKLEGNLSLTSMNKELVLSAGGEKRGNHLNKKDSLHPKQKKLHMFDSLRLNQQQNSKKLSYQRINYLLFKSNKGRSQSKTPIKSMQNFDMIKGKYTKKLRNTMMNPGKAAVSKQKINCSNHNDLRSNTCMTEINENNQNAKSVYLKYKETISMKLKEKIKKFAYNINSPTSIHLKKNYQLLKANPKQKSAVSHNFSNSYTHLANISDEKLNKIDNNNVSKRSTLKQILSPLRTSSNLTKTFKGFSDQRSNLLSAHN